MIALVAALIFAVVAVSQIFIRVLLQPSENYN